MTGNTQAPERHITGRGEELDVHSIFYTIQGEGPLSGRRAVFIRLAGCNLQCPGCDTEYTEGRRMMTITDIAVEAIAAFELDSGGLPAIVITGGEPLRQPIGPLVSKLVSFGFIVQIESNGMFAPDEVLRDQLIWNKERVMLVISPKTPKINLIAENVAHCFKYVLSAASVDLDDGLPIFALEHTLAKRVARPSRGIAIYLNPYDAKDEVANRANLKAAAESCMKHGYILGVQIHKLAGLA